MQLKDQVRNFSSYSLRFPQGIIFIRPLIYYFIRPLEKWSLAKFSLKGLRWFLSSLLVELLQFRICALLEISRKKFSDEIRFLQLVEGIKIIFSAKSFIACKAHLMLRDWMQQFNFIKSFTLKFVLGKVFILQISLCLLIYLLYT